LPQQGQVTERFTRAIDQLGNAQLDVRLGGIYALERIARDSPADRATIGEVLTAFVRSHAPWPPRLPGQYVAVAPIDEVPELQVRAPDVQASLTVLGRGGFTRPEGQDGRLDLHDVDLRNADLYGAHLEGVDLGGAHLEGRTSWTPTWKGGPRPRPPGKGVR
jgi:Pentapeptide repeats (8 copies)